MATRAQEAALLRAAVEAVVGNDFPNARVRTLAAAIEAIAPGRIERTRKAKTREAVAAKEAARWIGNPPAWAKRLIEKHKPTYVLHWRRSAESAYSSGHCYWGEMRIVVTANAGTSPAALDEQKAVLLHEIAHARTPGAKHGERFYDELLRLAKLEGHVRPTGERNGRNFAAAARRARKAVAA